MWWQLTNAITVPVCRATHVEPTDRACFCGMLLDWQENFETKRFFAL